MSFGNGIVKRTGHLDFNYHAHIRIIELVTTICLYSCRSLINRLHAYDLSSIRIGDFQRISTVMNLLLNSMLFYECIVNKNVNIRFIHFSFDSEASHTYQSVYIYIYTNCMMSPKPDIDTGVSLVLYVSKLEFNIYIFIVFHCRSTICHFFFFCIPSTCHSE